MNIMLRPLERLWKSMFESACETDPTGVLTLSAVLMLGILFAVVFMMIPSLRESGNEFIRNIPAYVEEIGQWLDGGFPVCGEIQCHSAGIRH